MFNDAAHERPRGASNCWCEAGLSNLTCLCCLCACATAVALIKATRTDVGRTVVVTVAGFLCVLLASPLYDVYSLHAQKHKTDSAETLLSESRR